MFALQYSAPQPSDPNQRDNYFLGQQTGFNQMAEVAEDRNKKRQIEQQQQQINLARQQEARVARDNALSRQLQARQLDIAEKEAPLVAMQKMLNLQKTQGEIDSTRSSLVSESNARNFDQTIQGGLNQYKNSTFSPLDNTNRSRKSMTDNQLEASPQKSNVDKLEELSKPSRVETSNTRQENILEPSLTSGLSKTAAAMLYRTATSSARDRLKESNEMSQMGKQREQDMLSKPITMNLATGFGVSNTRNSPYAGFEDEVDWGTL